MEPHNSKSDLPLISKNWFLKYSDFTKFFFLSNFRSRPRPKKKPPVPEGTAEAGAVPTGEEGEAELDGEGGAPPMETGEEGGDASAAGGALAKAKPKVKSNTPKKPKPNK